MLHGINRLNRFLNLATFPKLLIFPAKNIERQLTKQVGPPWYYELSVSQRSVLAGLKDNMHKDLLEDLPHRTRQALLDLGITLKFPRDILMKAMKNSLEDPGVFIWDLYKAVFKQSPSELRGSKCSFVYKYIYIYNC